MSVQLCHKECCLKNKMSRKALRTITLFVFMCCTYSVYKLPSLYWSFKSSQHQSIIVKEILDTKERHLAVDILKEKGNPESHNSSVSSVNGSQHKVHGLWTNSSKSKLMKSTLYKNTSEHNNSKFNFGNKENDYGNNISRENSDNFVPKHQQIIDTVNETVDTLNNTVNTFNDSDVTVKGNNETENGTKLDNHNNEEYNKILKEIDSGINTDVKYVTADEVRPDGEFVFENEDIEFNIKDVNIFQGTSEELFKTFPNHQNATKYLIYLCEGKCGGLADRLKGITMVYMMSLLTERRFAISMETPCEIENFLQPNLLDWRFPDKKKMIGMTIQTIDCFERHDAYEIDLQRFDPDPKSMLKADVVLMKANQDWTRIFRKLSVSPKRFPQLYQYHSSELLRTIYIGLFKSSNEVMNLVDEFFKNQVSGKKLACLHARMGEAIYQRYTYREIMIPLQFLKRFDDREDFKIMIATDTDNVKTIANHMFKNFVDTSGPILHIDYMRNGSMAKDLKCAGFMRSVVDHMVLQRCDKLVLTGSGFGVTAASIRHTSRGLHVYMRGETVMPTRRELLRETFQWRCLLRSFDSKFYSNICDS